jgi:DNA-binding NtrC family response regulator
MPADLLPTDPLIWDSSAEQARDKAFSLLVVQDGESYSYPLPASGKLLIGRAPHADVRIDHGSVSREHAVLHLGEILEIEDLDSANGSRLREIPLRPRARTEVFPDDVIDLGAVLLVIQYRRLEQRLRRSCDRAFLELRVEEECEQVAKGGPPLAVVEIEVEGGLGTHAVQLLLASQLRQQDLITSIGSGKYELLLPAISPTDAAARVAAMQQPLKQRSLRVRATVRCYPRDGASAFVRRPFAAATELVTPLPKQTPFIVCDEAMQRVCKLLARVAESELPLMLLGETGVGKELCAELVHELSPRAAQPFLRLSCASLSEAVLETELFGYDRGAFPGASADKPGVLEAAAGGSLFLDEIGDLPLGTQIKLLRVFEAKQVLRLAARTPRAIDLRVIAATHQDLNERITAGLFRADLFYRLNGISVIVPPLRERHDDIEPLARHFLALQSKRGRKVPDLSHAAIDLLEGHSWPGNVRELRNLIERALVLCEGSAIEPRHLPLDASPTRPSLPARPSSPSSGLRDEVKSLERQRIERALGESRGNQRLAAEKLGLSRGALLRRLELFGIARPRKNS